MKKCFIGLFAAVLAVSMAGCKGEVESGTGEGSSSGNDRAGKIALERIKIGEIEYDYTAQVYVTGTNGAEIEGKTNTFNYEGVFVEWRDKIYLSPFIMSKYEVTQELYTAVMTGQKVIVSGIEHSLDADPSFCKGIGEYPLVSGETQKYRPVEGVTWYDAVYFCNELSEKTGLTKAYDIKFIYSVSDNGHITDALVSLVPGADGYRLPTEAEWEFTARGGDPTKPDWDYTFSGSTKADGSNYRDNKNSGLDLVAWYFYNSINGTTGDTTPSIGQVGYGTHQVGKKAANALGIFDMSGNVREWCYDYYGYAGEFDDGYRVNEVVVNPAGELFGDKRVYRGGSCSPDCYARGCSVCCRGGYIPGINTDYYLGIRLVRNVN